MSAFVYSRWDGTRPEFRLDADRALDALAEFLLEGLGAREALEWMRRHGFELGGLDARVMGAEELIAELRDRLQSLYDRYSMDGALDAPRRRLDEILDREQRALSEGHGYESARMNDFLERRHAETAELSDAIERFRDYAFEDAGAGEDFQELLDELDRLRQLERFLRASPGRAPRRGGPPGSRQSRRSPSPAPPRVPRRFAWFRPRTLACTHDPACR